MTERRRAVLLLFMLLAGSIVAAAPVLPASASGINLSPSDRVLVVAPHPDDETLGAAGLIQAAQELHALVHVVVVTNGDGSTPAAAKFTGNPFVTASDRIRLGHARQAESTAALSLLGVKGAAVRFLGYPDKSLMTLWQDKWKTAYYSTSLGASNNVYRGVRTPHAPFTGAAVAEDLAAVVHDFRPTVIVVPSTLDLHPDHRAAALFAQQAVIENPTLHPRLYAYIVHRGPWPAAGHYLTVPDSALAAHLEWYNLPLKSEWVAKKAEAIRLYKTQIAISPAYLLRFAKPNELFAEVRDVRLGATDELVSSESEARAGLRDVAVPHEQVLALKHPGIWNAVAHVTGNNLHVRLTSVVPELVPTEYTFMVRDGDRFVRVTTPQPSATIPLRGDRFFITAQFTDARGHLMSLPWVAANRVVPPREPVAPSHEQATSRVQAPAAAVPPVTPPAQPSPQGAR